MNKHTDEWTDNNNNNKVPKKIQIEMPNYYIIRWYLKSVIKDEIF